MYPWHLGEGGYKQERYKEEGGGAVSSVCTSGPPFPLMYGEFGPFPELLSNADQQQAVTCPRPLT